MFTELGSEIPLMNICNFMIDAYDLEIKVLSKAFFFFFINNTVPQIQRKEIVENISPYNNILFNYIYIYNRNSNSGLSTH